MVYIGSQYNFEVMKDDLRILKNNSHKIVKDTPYNICHKYSLICNENIAIGEPIVSYRF